MCSCLKHEDTMQFLHSFSRSNWCLVDIYFKNQCSVTWHFLPTHTDMFKQHRCFVEPTSSAFFVVRKNRCNITKHQVSLYISLFLLIRIWILTSKYIKVVAVTCCASCTTCGEKWEERLFISVITVIHCTNLSSCAKISTSLSFECYG